MIRRIVWWFRRLRPAGAAESGACAWCGAPLQACGGCDGDWRGRTCDCGIGLVCPAHGRHWS